MAQHFGTLAKSKVDESAGLQDVLQRMDTLVSESHSKEDSVLDIPFSAEEVAHAVKKLKRRKSARPHGSTAEHLMDGGEVKTVWLMEILNSMVE